MGTLLQDLRYGLRMLAKNPGFTAVAVLTLALGIAANTSIFSMVSGVLLRRPPVSDPEKVMVVVSTNAAKGWNLNTISVPDFLEWREQNHAFEDMAATQYTGFTLTGAGEPERLSVGLRVSANYFRVLGVSAALGRTFLPGEDQPGHEHVVILSHGLWQQRFGSDPNLIGKTLKLDEETYTVVGVMPARFVLVDFDAQAWTPIVFKPEQLAARGNRLLTVVARLRPGMRIPRAQSEMTAIARRLEQRYPETSRGWSARVMTLERYMIEDASVESAIMVLMGVVVFVLLIGCANLTNLLLARASVRQRELAIRAALGAGRLRLVRQLLMESLLVALLGGVLGLLLAVWGVDLLRDALNWQPYVRSMAREIAIDQRVLAFTLGVSVLTPILFGMAPALHSSALDLNRTLKEGGRTASGGSLRSKMRGGLVVGEIALALVLLTAAGLFAKDFLESIRGGFGIDPNKVLTATVSVSGTRYSDPPKQAAFFQDVVRRLETFPGVISAGATTILPPSENGRIVSFSIEGQPELRRTERPRTRYFAISPNYLRTMRIPVIRGRGFRVSDDPRALSVTLVNLAFVQRFFPNEEPLGKRIRIDATRSDRPDWSQIAGVVGNVKNWFGERHDSPQVYECHLQRPAASMTLVVRTSSEPSSLAPTLRRAVWDVDKNQSITDLRTMTQVIADSGAGDRLMSTLMGVFAALALVLAAVGVFGVIAYMVAQRTHEIGIRTALGAQRTDVLRLVVGRGMLLAALGTLIGLSGALPLPRLLKAAFPGLNAHASPVFVVVPLLVWVAALLACYVPARRATKVDPMVALRYE